MKLLHVISGMDPEQGGVCQGLRTIVAGLNDLGIVNEIVSIDDPASEFIKKDPLRIHAIGSGSGPWQYNKKLLPWLVENLPGFDGVVVHGIWLYHGYAVRKAVNMLKKKFDGIVVKIPKVFIFPQGMLDPYFQKASGRRLKALRNYFFWKLVEGKVVNEADAVFFTAEMEMQLAHKPFQPYQPKNESVVGMGVHAVPGNSPILWRAFSERCPEVKPGKYLLFLSRIHEKKGVDVLVKAYQAICEKTNYQIPKLVIAGPGIDSIYGQEIKKFVDSSTCLKGSVFFAGMLAGDAKWGAFYNCQAFVLPTHQENFGIAIVEALACAKPVLISDKTNIWKEIDRMKAGIISDDTVAGTIDSLEQWMALNDKEKSEMGKNAFDAYRRFFALDTISEKWHTSLKEIIYPG